MKRDTRKILVISSYPRRGTLHGNRFSAVAGYCKNTLDAMDAASSAETDYVVLADVLDEPRSYREGNREVIRCWRRNDWFVYAGLLRRVLSHGDFRTVLLQFEFGMFGNRKVLVGLLPLFILGLRLMGRKVHLVSHGVITSAAEVSGQLGMTRRSALVRVYDFLLRNIYRFLVLFSSRTIVFEEYLRKKLLGVVNLPDRVTVIPHGVERRPACSREAARARLGLSPEDFVVLNFGFLIWYKGSDWLAESFLAHLRGRPQTRARLIFAGGPSNVHRSDPVYAKYVEDLRGVVARDERMSITGYIREEKIDRYFAASDLVVLPYRVLISASGPFSFSIAHRKPFLLSSSLRGYLDSADFESAVAGQGLGEEDLYFDLTTESFSAALTRLERDPELLAKVGKVASGLFESRSWESVGKMYVDSLAEGGSRRREYLHCTRQDLRDRPEPAAPRRGRQSVPASSEHR
jgi:glycosyltransferase involved in cell wall biosynthesis